MSALVMIHRHFLLVLCITIFVSTLLPKLLSPEFSSMDDPYYHAAHSRAYVMGDTLTLPRFSPLAISPTDPWFLYHVGMVPFIWLFGNDDAGTILASKVYHASLATLLFASIFMVAKLLATQCAGMFRSWAQNTLQLDTPLPQRYFLTPHTVAIITIVTLYVTSPFFIYRTLIIERPHTVMIMLTLWAFVTVFTKRYVYTAGIAAVAALSYSLSLLVLLPIVGAWIAWLLVKCPKPVWVSFALSTVAAVLGITIGTLIHPDWRGYIINGIGIHLYAIWHALLWWTHDTAAATIPPSEMFLLQVPPTLAQMIMVAIVGFVATRLISSAKTKLLGLAEIAFVAAAGIGIGFTLLQIIIPRSIEYGAPFLAITSSIVIGLLATPLLRHMHNKGLVRPGEIGDYYRRIVEHAADIAADPRLRKFCVGFLIVLFAFGPLLVHISSLQNDKDASYERYAEVADFLAKVPDHVLLTEQFDVYPQLIFLNHNNNYGTGMDSRFIDLYDNTLSADVAAFWKFTPCETTHCTDTVVPPLSFYQHSITHVLVDANETTEAFVQQMNMSPAYRLVMTDSRHPEVQLYELLPQTP